MVRLTPGHKRSNFQIGVFNKKTCVSEQVWSQDLKNVIFITVRCLKMLQIAGWKMTSSADAVFGQCVCKNRYINVKLVTLYAQVRFCNIVYVFDNFDNFGFWEKLYTNFGFSFFGESKKTYGKVRDNNLKELLILCLLVLFVCVLL